VPNSSRGKFSLISQPQALPDDDTPPAGPRQTEQGPQTEQGREQAAPPGPAKSGQALKAPTSPARSAPPVAAAPKPSQPEGKIEAEAPVTARAASTVRLRPSAAEPLNAAWLDERRRNNPKLSYPEFASRIVSLGLAAYEKQKPS
jgi:hypothetical protein